MNQLCLYKTAKNSKPRLGRIVDIQTFDFGTRVKVERPTQGSFLSEATIAESLESPNGLFVKDKRWCFFQWMKMERIIRML